jgi:hypothetical protein
MERAEAIEVLRSITPETKVEKRDEVVQAVICLLVDLSEDASRIEAHLGRIADAIENHLGIS